MENVSPSQKPVPHVSGSGSQDFVGVENSPGPTNSRSGTPTSPTTPPVGVPLRKSRPKPKRRSGGIDEHVVGVVLRYAQLFAENERFADAASKVFGVSGVAPLVCALTDRSHRTVLALQQIETLTQRNPIAKAVILGKADAAVLNELWRVVNALHLKPGKALPADHVARVEMVIDAIDQVDTVLLGLFTKEQ